MNKNVLAGLAVLIVIALGAAFYFNSINKPPGNANDVKVRIGYLNIVASLPLFIAEEEGFFEDEGIEYEATVSATSNQLVDAILADNLDLFVESSAVPVLAVELQSPGKLKVFSVSEITENAPFDALLVKSDSVISSIRDLPGKKIGVFPGSTATNLLRKYLADQGVEVSSITFVPLPPTDHITALTRGSVDAVHAYEPTTAIATTSGGAKQIHGSVYAGMLSPNPQGVAVIATSFSENNPEVAEKVIRALERSMQFMVDNEDETRQILVKRMNLTEEVANRVVFLYMLPHDEIPVDVFQEYSDMLTGLGELTGNVNVAELLYK
jgi:ABC-type nitrate/sulfonate/bicarbonate transport system substrate-binding protein